jgi:hypothetical protein
VWTRVASRQYHVPTPTATVDATPSMMRRPNLIDAADPSNGWNAEPRAPLRRSSAPAPGWPVYTTSIRSAQISMVSPDCISIQNRLPSSPCELMDADIPHGAS